MSVEQGPVPEQVYAMPDTGINSNRGVIARRVIGGAIVATGLTAVAVAGLGGEAPQPAGYNTMPDCEIDDCNASSTTTSEFEDKDQSTTTTSEVVTTTTTSTPESTTTTSSSIPETTTTTSTSTTIPTVTTTTPNVTVTTVPGVETTQVHVPEVVTK